MNRLCVIGILLSLLITLQVLIPIGLAQYPWSPSTGKEYPWIDYLASLTTERNVKLIIITRHESSILSLTRTMFLNSEVAKKLGITELQFLQVSAELWPSYIQKAAQQGTPIDVAWGGGPTLFNNLDDLGFLMPINPSSRPEHYAVIYELSKIPERIAGAETYKEDPDGNIHWIGASLSSFGFTVNKEILNRYGVPKPVTWEDLTRPEYAKYLPGTPLIGTADPTQSTSTTRIFEIILQAKGWEEGWRILTLMGANARIYPGSGDARDAVIRGDVAVSTTIDFYGYMAMYVNPNCEYIAPQGETIVNADPIAILKDTKHPVHAAAFVAWVLSEYGCQQVWLDKDINRIPINPNTFNTTAGQQRPDLKQAFEQLSALSGIEFNETLSAMWVNAVMYYYKATVVNAHDDLQAAWAQIANAYLNGKISRDWFDYLTRELTKPLKFIDPLTQKEVEFTLDYALIISRELTKGQIYQALMSAWTSKAGERYQYVLNLLQKALSGEPVPTKPSPTTTTTSTSPSTTTTTPTTPTTPTTTTPTASISPPGTTQTTQPSGVSLTMIGLVVVLVLVVIALFLLMRRK